MTDRIHKTQMIFNSRANILKFIKDLRSKRVESRKKS